MKYLCKSSGLLASVFVILSIFQCQATGPRGQSPVDLANAYLVDLKDIDFRFYNNPVTVDVINKGHTIQCNIKAASNNSPHIILDGSRYDLLQFHTHTPSEHTVNGMRYDLEIHFVHKNAVGKLAVVGVVCTTDPAKAISALPNKASAGKGLKKGLNKRVALRPLLQLIKPHANNSAASNKHSDKHTVNNATENISHTDEHKEVSLGAISINPGAIFPPEKLRYRYPGSLTTKPFTEGVEWNVIAQTIIVHPDLVKAITSLTGPNSARDVQPIAGRAVLLDCVTDSPVAVS